MTANFKIFLLIFLSFFITSCSIQINSIVNSDEYVGSYDEPLVIIIDDESIINFSADLDKKLAIALSTHTSQINIKRLFIPDKQLSFDIVNPGFFIEKLVEKHNPDLLLIFNPTAVKFTDNKLTGITYEITGYDTKTNKAIWKAIVDSGTVTVMNRASSLFTEAITENLKRDKIIN